MKKQKSCYSKPQVPAIKPNYSLQMFCLDTKSRIKRFWLEDTRDFYSDKEIEEITYWKNNKCFVISKIDPNEVEVKPRKNRKNG